MLTKKELEGKLLLVIERLLQLGGADYDMDKSTDADTQRMGMVARDFGIEEWDWPQGIGLYGLYRAREVLRESQYDGFFKEWFSRHFEQGLPSRNVNTTAPFLTLACLSEEWKDRAYQEECLKHAKWLMECMPRTRENGFQHVVSAIGDRQGVRLNDSELWIDTLVMAVLFLNRVGRARRREDFCEEALHQVLLHIKYLYDKQKGLFYHGWSFQRNDNFGGVYWCRGNSWFTFGILEYLEQAGSRLTGGVRTYLTEVYRAQAEALLQLQDKSGLWHTVLEEPDSYLEVSGSAAITTGILKGMRMGLLPKSYEVSAKKAVEAICENIAEDGTVEKVSAGTAIGMDSAYYKNIHMRPMAYGQALVILALTEALIYV